MSIRTVAALAFVLSGTGYSAERPFSIRTLAGSDFAGDGGPAAAAPLRQLEGLAVDPLGNIYISDTGDNRVRRISTDGIIQTVAGDGHAGFRGDGGPAQQAQLRAPYGLALDNAGNLFIADLGNSRVRKVTPDGRIYTVAGGGARAPSETGSATEARLEAPRNLAFDRLGQLYFSDFSAHRVYGVTASGALRTVAGTGRPGSGGDGGFALSGQLNSPASLAVGLDGALYIADSGNRRIRRVLRGMIDSLGVSGMPAWVFPIPLYAPTGLSIDAAGTLYIADGDQTLRMPVNGTPAALPGGSRDIATGPGGAVYTAGGSLLRRINGPFVSVVAGNAGYGFFGEGIPALAARFQQPSGLAVDGSGNIYVADERNNRIRKINPSGIVTTVSAAAPLNSPAGVAADAAGNLYISDTGNHRVRKLSVGGELSTLASIDTPTGLALDAAGYLYVADAGTSRILRVSPSGLATAMAGSGIRGFSGDGGPAAMAQFDRPRGIALDNAGNLYVADTGNNRIRKVDAQGMVGTVMTGLNGPCGVAVDALGSVYAADTGFHRIRKAAPGGEPVTIAGTAEEGFNGETGAALDLQLSYPTGLLFDMAGNLLASDTGNNRVRLLSQAQESVAPPEPVLQVRILHAATRLEGPFAAGQIVIIDGLPLSADVVISWDDVPDGALSTAGNLITLLVPARVAGQDSTRLRIGNFERDVPLISAAPGIFARDGGAGPAYAFNEDGSANSLSKPAVRGSIVTLFGTGEGVSRLPITVTVGGAPAEVVFAGSSADAPGMLQIRARVPNEAASGSAGVTLTVGSIASPANATLAVE